jgi:hypothetical protein
MRRLTALLALSLATTSPLTAQSSRTALASGSWAITNVNVIPMTSDTVFRGVTVLVRDGRIAEIGSRVRLPSGTRRIDGRGKYLIPGLFDMHAHLYADESVPDSVAPYELGVFIANGVTTARLMIGTPTHLELRRQLAAGRIRGPQLWVASPQFAGRADPHSMLATNPDEARRGVRAVVDSGYDLIKLTVLITPEVYDAVIDEARLRRIKVAGHVDTRVGVARALAAGQQIEHFDAYSEALLADSAPMRVAVSDMNHWRKANWAALDHMDDRKVEALAGATARAGVPVTPTQAFFTETFALAIPDSVRRSRPDFAHIPNEVRDLWLRALGRYWTGPPSEERRMRYLNIRERLIKGVVDSGGRIFAGSDAPGGLQGYGWGLHRELEYLVRAGLTPYQALQAATVWPAEWLGATESATIRPGQRADLVLLDANPLTDIRNTTRIAGVAVGGHYSAKPELEQMIAEAGRRLVPPATSSP